MEDGKQVLRYLRGTTGLGIVYLNNNEGSRVVAYSVSDWVHERSSRKSISGGVLMLAGGLISWWSKQQTVVAQSTKEVS